MKGHAAPCGSCGGGHATAACWRHYKGWPVETPSHNGPYRGTVAVRVIPSGICGAELTISESARLAGERARAKVAARSAERRATRQERKENP